MGDKEQDRLDSWKQIADHLGRDVRTAIRWERERGLPVHRLPGGRRSSVFALRSELDQWLLSSQPQGNGRGPAVGGAPSEALALLGGDSGSAAPAGAATGRTAPPPQSRRWHTWLASTILGVAAILLLALALRADAFRTRQHPQPLIAAITLSGTQLRTFDAADAPLWAHDFGRQVVARNDPEPNTSPIMLFAVSNTTEGDAPTLFVSVTFGDDAARPSWTELCAFSGAGRLLWSRKVEETLTFGAGRFGPPWIGTGPGQGRGVVLFRVDGQERVAWSQCHHTWWHSILTVFDTSGRALSRWVHSGSIHALAATRVGRPLLLVGGISNSREAAFLAVLDARHVEGRGPEEAGSPFECISCEHGDPLRYFVMPPSELMRAVVPYNSLAEIWTDEAGFEARSVESIVHSAFPIQGISRFSPDLVLQHTAWSSGWDSRHRELEQAGRIDHTVEHCPERGGRPRVREWTAQAGWRELTPADAATTARTAHR